MLITIELIILWVIIGFSGGTAAFLVTRYRYQKKHIAISYKAYLPIFLSAFLLLGGLFGLFGFITRDSLGGALGMVFACIVSWVFATAVFDMRQDHLPNQ
ncbi:MAG: hypothetical protein Kow0080_21520 [Candidatus Promineifilaceae bacterium]